MLWEISSYLDRKALVALATSCKTIKLLVYSPQLQSDTELELNTRNSVNKPTALSFAVRNITRVRVTDGFNTCKLQKRKMSDEERARQNRNIDEASVAKTMSGHNEWTRDYVKELFITLSPPKINKAPSENWSCFNKLQCLALFYNHSLSSDPSFRLLSQVYYSWCEAISKLVHLQKLVFILSVTNTVGCNDTLSQ